MSIILDIKLIRTDFFCKSFIQYTAKNTAELQKNLS